MNNKYQKAKVVESKKEKQALIDKKKDRLIIEQSDKAIELIMYNKINSKNAFDVNVEFLESISDLLNKKQDNSWQKASASLDATAKIYGYRVDSVHTDTYRFLGGLARNERRDEDEKGEPSRKERERRAHGKHEGYSTLEKDPKRLNLIKYETEFEPDPLFRTMTAKFAETGAKGLLLYNLHLDNNVDLLLQAKDEELPEDKLAKCSMHSRDLTAETKRIVDCFTSSMTVNELTSMQIAPDLGYFKRTRELDTSLEKTFYNNFMQELENNEGDIDNLNDSVLMMSMGDNMRDNLSIMSQNRSEIESALSQQLDEGGFDNDVNLAGNLQNLNNTAGFIGEGFSLFKHEDIIQHQGQFGDGSRGILKNMPQFLNFVKAFNQLDKNAFMRKAGVREAKKAKKEEKLFDFSEENEVSKAEIFGKESKRVAQPGASKREKKKKVKTFFNFDKYSVFKLFTQPSKQIIQSDINLQRNEGQNEEMLGNEQNISGNVLPPDDAMGVSMDNEAIGDAELANQPNVSFMKYDQEYEKKFGHLYRRFDVRFVKSKLWDSFEKIEVNPNKKEEVGFKSVIGEMNSTLTKSVIDNITTPTCFVCFLHLCNEKNLELKQDNDSNFYIGQARE